MFWLNSRVDSEINLDTKIIKIVKVKGNEIKN